jgi:hypothetical protein
MFIATERLEARTPSGVPCGGYGRLHITPDGVSRPSVLVTINIALLTEGKGAEHLVAPPQFGSAKPAG